jgi:trigger factor
MIQGFESGLIDARPGEERKLELTFPEEYHESSLRGRQVSFNVSVKAVAEPEVPMVDGDFARAFGIADGDVERFKSDVRSNMERELSQRVEALVKNQAMDILLEANPIDLPRVLISEEIGALKEQAERAGAGAGGKVELPDELFEQSARRRVALGLIIAEVVRVNDIQIDEDRVRAAVEDMAATYEQPQEVIDYYYRNKESRQSIETLTLEGQVVDWVLQQLTVEDEPKSFQELTDPASGG